ncbi:hypothetical protein AV530_014842 [Patagioenas fasciata monilis]|uniref:Uncharacterized protein n=1 Tax=Patagioenas fasciata monilis TaxID=372326 RepID=A0A1V4L0T2_PATFA|nr:hypothetical protein AV530_014842 [Patagioenas fasciata monilis]
MALETDAGAVPSSPQHTTRRKAVENSIPPAEAAASRTWCPLTISTAQGVHSRPRQKCVNMHSSGNVSDGPFPALF